ncbi:hypothetical protein Tco_0441870 [Tanacetum coccineum]
MPMSHILPSLNSKTGLEVDAENTGLVVDGKVNVDTDGDGIGLSPGSDNHLVGLSPKIDLHPVKRMDLLSFIRTVDPTKVRVGERQRAEDEPKLLDTTVGRVVPLLPVAPARGESELEDSMDKLFDEGDNDDQAEQGDSASGGQGVGIQFVYEAAKVVAEDVASLQPRRQKKRKTVFALQRLLVGAVLNLEVEIAAFPTLPFVTSSVSATPEREGEDQTDSVAGANLRTIIDPLRFVISSDSSHHSGTNVAEAEVDFVIRSPAPAIATITTVTATVVLGKYCKQT